MSPFEADQPYPPCEVGWQPSPQKIILKKFDRYLWQL